jgi:branched-chain amino acid transport system ATP-binding protein
MTMLSIANLFSGYGSEPVLKNLSLHVNEQEIVSVIGSNGAGKTTLLRTISRMLPLQSGTLAWRSQPLNTFAAEALPALGIAHVPEGRKIFARMSVLENLELGAFIVNDHAVIQERIERAFELFPILAERRHQLGGLLSGGEQQMLALARALMSNPSLLLLDEPSMGVAPKIIEKIFETLESLNKNGMSILLVEQNAHLALSCCHRAYVLSLGEITKMGTGAELLADDTVKQAYLG